MVMYVTIRRTGLVAGVLCLLAGTSIVAAEVKGEQGAPVKSAVTSTAKQTEEDQKAAWQKRMADARNELADALSRKFKLEQKRDKLKYEWAEPGSKRTNVQIDAELGQTNAELLQAQQDIDAATNLIEVVIPDEARKAEIPPGWLR